MFQSDAAHKGVVGGKHHPLLGNTTWTVKTGGKIFSSPVVLKNTVYVGSEDGYVYAIDATTGKESWKFKTQGAVHSTPALHAGNLYVGSFDGSYYCLNSKSGTEVWKFKTGGERWPGGKGYFGLKPDTMDMSDPWDYFLSSPVIVEGQEGVTVFFGSSDGNVYAVDGKTGMLRWKYHTDGIVHSSPAVSEGVLYIGGWDTYLYAINASTGKLLWKFKTGGQFAMSGIQTSPTIANGTVYFGARDASFYAVDAKTGGVNGNMMRKVPGFFRRQRTTTIRYTSVPPILTLYSRWMRQQEVKNGAVNSADMFTDLLASPLMHYSSATSPGEYMRSIRPPETSTIVLKPNPTRPTRVFSNQMAR